MTSKQKNGPTMNPLRRIATIIGLGALIGLALSLMFAVPTWATGDQDQDDIVAVFAVAPTFADPTCDTAGDFTLPDVQGLDYRYNEDMEAPLDEPQFFVTVEPLEGYEISGFGAGFDASFDTGFEEPIAPGAWVHESTQPSGCDDAAPADDDSNADNAGADDSDAPVVLPNTGPTGDQFVFLAVGVFLIVAGVLAYRRGRVS